MKQKPLVIIESPYAGDGSPESLSKNIEYARQCVLDSIREGERPFASHLFYTQMLDDNNKEERALGMSLGFDFVKDADKVAVYCDRDISAGMEKGLDIAMDYGKVIEFRSLENKTYSWKDIK